MNNLLRYPLPRAPQAGKVEPSQIVKVVPADPAPSGRIMSSLVDAGGLASKGGLAGEGGGLAG